MATIKDRLLQVIEVKKVSNRAFCNSIGVSHSYLNDLKTMQSDKLAKIVDVYPDVDLTWLITGKGVMIVTDHDRLFDEAMVNQIIESINYGHETHIEELKAEIEELKKIEPQMLVGSDEGAKLAVQVQKDTIMELQAKLIKCMEGKSYMLLSMNEAMPKGE